jgi:hypothetical protein
MFILKHMDWQRLLDADIQKFIVEHENADVAGLALKAAPDDVWDYPLVLDQIKARQKAGRKVAAWLDAEGLVFPPSHVMEQASSAACARYKASLVAGGSFVDLTGGVGVDSWAFLERFESGVAVERDAGAAEMIAHNVGVLSDKRFGVVHGEAEDYVAHMDAVDLAYIDPQRRDGAGGAKGKFKLDDCSPDVLGMMAALLDKAQTVMVKTSLMLDIWAGIEALGNVCAVHVVEWRGECKEVLYILRKERECLDGDVPVSAVSIDDEGVVLNSFTFSRDEEVGAQPVYDLPQKYLYEPSAAFQKAGGFKAMAGRYGVVKLHADTHLYSSQDVVTNFPGRAFKIVGKYPVQAKKVPLKKAHLTVRNFPQKTEILRKKLKLADGGDDYLFACTLMDGERVLLHGLKP